MTLYRLIAAALLFYAVTIVILLNAANRMPGVGGPIFHQILQPVF